MIKNQKFTATATDYTYDGLSVIKYDTFCVFVKDMIKGEEGQIVVTSVKKDYGYGKLLSLIKQSDQRVEPVCPISKICGGCQLQHMSAKEQASFKQGIVQNDISRIAKLDNQVNPIISMTIPYGYRNKVMLPVGKDKEDNTQIGFYRYNSHEIIPVENCALQSEKSNRLINKLKQLIDQYNLADQIRHLMIRDMHSTSEMMLVIVTYKDKCDLKQLVKDIVEFEPSIKSVIQNVNGKDTNVVLGDKEITLYGKEYIEDILCGLRFRISSHSFYQVNSRQTEVLYSKVVEMAHLNKEDTVLDLYCGVGTIGMIASKHCKKVYGVEIVADAVEDGKINASINGIKNVELLCGDAKDITSQLLQQGIMFDCMFIDPPRKGCSKEAINTIVSSASKKLVYISCNPSTLARDLQMLKEYYDVVEIQPVDMFPNTYHTETIALLVRK